MKRNILTIKSNLRHKEAYCHMHYQCEAGHVTSIWNSRDGVTPFVLICPREGCNQETRHVDWQEDVLDPDYELQPGDWYWRDGTLDEMREIMRRRVEQMPEYVENIMANMGVDTVEEMIEALAQREHERYPAPGWPMLDRKPDA